MPKKIISDSSPSRKPKAQALLSIPNEPSRVIEGAKLVTIGLTDYPIEESVQCDALIPELNAETGSRAEKQFQGYIETIDIAIHAVREWLT